MRVKMLRRKDASTVLLVYPTTPDEYRQSLKTLVPATLTAAGSRTSDTVHGPYVVTTEEQRRRWGLPDLAARGGARVVTESQAFELLDEPGAWSAAAELPADAEAVAAPSDAEPDTPGLAAVRELVEPGPRVDRVLAALESGVLPRLDLRHAAARSAAVGRVRESGSRGSAGPGGVGHRPAVADARAHNGSTRPA